MSVSTSKNNLSVIIGKNIGRTASVQYTDPNAANYLADGEVLVVNETGAILTDASTVGTAPRFRVVQRAGNRLVYSPLIHGANIKRYRGIDGSAATEQTYTYGYNGSAAASAIDVSGTDDFLFNLTFTFDESMWSEQLNNYPFLVEYFTGITEANVADSLAEQINIQMTNNGSFSIAGEGPIVRATVLCNHAGTAISVDATDTVVGYAGSRTVTITDTGGDLSVTALSAGDYLRVGTATTAAVYRIVTSTVGTGGGVLTLNMPLQANVSLLGTTAEYITAVQAAAAQCGVAITGQALKTQLHPQCEFKYLQVSFKGGLKQGWGTTTVTKVEPVRPVNIGIQIAELEQYAEGFRGNLNRTVVPLTTLKQDADTSAVYDVINVVWYDTTDTSPVDGTKPSEQELMIAIVDGAGQIAAATNGVLTVLNAYMLTTPSAFPNVTL